VVDTGVVVAAADADDAWTTGPAPCLRPAALTSSGSPTPVATETAWLIGSRLGPATEAALVAFTAAGLTLAELPSPMGPMRR